MVKRPFIVVVSAILLVGGCGLQRTGEDKITHCGTAAEGYHMVVEVQNTARVTHKYTVVVDYKDKAGVATTVRDTKTITVAGRSKGEARFLTPGKPKGDYTCAIHDVSQG